MEMRIKELREKRQITQEQLAKMSGVSRATIASIESGAAINVTIGTLRKLARALEVDVTVLFAQEV